MTVPPQPPSKRGGNPSPTQPTLLYPAQPNPLAVLLLRQSHILGMIFNKCNTKERPPQPPSEGGGQPNPTQPTLPYPAQPNPLAVPLLRQSHILGMIFNKCNTKERRHGIFKPLAWRIQVRATCSYSTRASEPARARLLWANLSLILPVTFGHTTACRSPALAFSAAIHFAMKYSAPYSAVLRRPPSSWIAVVYWSALMPKSLRSSRKHSTHSFSWPPTQTAPPTNTFEHHALRQSRILHTRHKSREEDLPAA